MPDEAIHVARAVAALDDRHACRERVLAALEDVMKFDDDPVLRAAARRRYVTLTNQSAA